MKAGVLVPTLSHRAGGLGDSARRLTEELRNVAGLTPEVLTPSHGDASWSEPHARPLSVHPFATVGPAPFDYAPGLARHLRALDVDLVHVHGLWTYLSVVAHAWGQRARRPYLVTPHGMLDPWALRHSRWKKRVAGWLYERRHLRDAACLHAVSGAERDAFRRLGLQNPVCVIHNGVDLPPPAAVPTAAPWAGQVAAGRKVLLYLGRLHPKKGLPNVLRAWAAVRRQQRTLTEAWCLVMVGWDQGGHGEELRRLADNLRLTDDIVFAGPYFGEERSVVYRQAHALILASLSEGMPLVVLEAWAHSLPVLMTRACNLPEGLAAGAALQTDPDVPALGSALEALFRTTGAERQEMGRRGRELVEGRFQWSQAAAEMHEVYRWMLEGGPRPDSVSG